MNIVIASDHRGFLHKEYIKQYNMNSDIVFIDVGTYSQERTDYPLYAHKACKTMVDGHAKYAVLLCGTGIGMSIVANRNKYMYAALVWSVETAIRSKAEDNANILVIPSDYVSCEESMAMIIAWQSTEFKGDRYAKRIAMIDEL